MVPSSAPKASAKAAAGPALARDDAVAAIEASFAAAREPPAHPTKRHLRPVDVMPVLPDAERWGHAYVHIVSTGHFLSVLDAPGSSEAERVALAARAVLKCYNLRAPPLACARPACLPPTESR
jgi:Paf1